MASWFGRGWFALGVVLLGCGAFECGAKTARLRRNPADFGGLDFSFVPLRAASAEGISGAASASNGRVWIVTERQHTLQLMMRRAGAWVPDGKALSLPAIDGQLELESLALLDDGALLIGTESSVPRVNDQLLVVDVSNDNARVLRHITVDHDALGVRVDGNHGIEGACAVRDALVLGVEARMDDGTAALIVHGMRDNTWRLHRLRLTTDEGKLASLDCKASRDEGVLDVIAIERHYGVARVLAFELDLAAAPSSPELEARVLIDLATWIEPLPNFESLVWLDDQLLLITDNHHGHVTGPSQALRIKGLSLLGERVQRAADGQADQKR